jgi:hypothetical protein
MPKPKIIYKRLGKKKPQDCPHCMKRTAYGEWKGELNFKPANGKIYIDPRHPSESELLDTLTHELLHDCMPFLEEFAVRVYGTHIAQALWREGWRPTKKVLKDK